MNQPATLDLRLQLRGDVLSAVTSAGAARLDADVVEELVERVAALPRSTPVRLRVHVPADESIRDQIPALVRQHYARLCERTAYRVRRTVRAGLLSLVVGVVVLLAALGLGEAAARMVSGGLGAFFQEGLTIVGWVALWRPLDLLLFERWALWREIALYRRLEGMEISVGQGSSS